MKKLVMALSKKTALKGKQRLSLTLESMKSASLRISASVLAFAVGGATVAFAQEYGTSASPTFDAKGMAQSAVAAVLPAPAMIFTNANYGTGGVALRNRGEGSIGVSGVVGPVKAAFIYWAVIGPNASAGRIRLQRRFPTPVSAIATLIGAVVGVGPNPCWAPAPTPLRVYRAAIPLSIATGNGDYEVSLLPGAGGSTAGGDPWVGAPVPP